MLDGPERMGADAPPPVGWVAVPAPISPERQDPRGANVVGVGLISGVDDDTARTDRALELGVIDSVGLDPDAEVTFVATPVTAVAEAAGKALARTVGLVTDVGSVKAPVVATVDSPRFVGGHPMAGSEQEGVEGADPDLFEGAVWVLTPTVTTDDAAYARVRSIISSFGAEVLALPPDRHDELVAVVSHVPHLTAASLMRIADERADEHAALLRLAAGGFRDMTRIASGHPGIWPDICAENRAAIVAGLTNKAAPSVFAKSRYTRPSELSEVRIPVADRPGSLADVTTLATELGVNIVDLEIAHSAEGVRGVLIMVVESGAADLFRGGLIARGYRPSVQALQ